MFGTKRDSQGPRIAVALVLMDTAKPMMVIQRPELRAVQVRSAAVLAPMATVRESQILVDRSNECQFLCNKPVKKMDSTND